MLAKQLFHFALVLVRFARSHKQLLKISIGGAELQNDESN